MQERHSHQCEIGISGLRDFFQDSQMLANRSDIAPHEGPAEGGGRAELAVVLDSLFHNR